MSSYKFKMILKSYVSEQAYLPFKPPLSACVCRLGSKGLMESFLSSSSYVCWSKGFFLSSFLACLRKPFSSSSLIGFRFIKNRLHCLFSRITNYGVMFFFSLQHSLFKSFSPALSVKQICSEIPDFSKGIFREPDKYFLDIINLCNCYIHDNIIAYFYETERDKNLKVIPR